MKSNKRVCVLAISVLTILFGSCALSDAPGVNVRTTITSSGNGIAKVRVYIEGPDGRIVDAALVQLSESSGTCELLPFDATACLYETSRTIPADGLFFVSVRSVLMEQTYERTISHLPVGTNPVVTVFADAQGNSVLNGEVLDRTSGLQIAWESLGDDIVYSLTIRTATSVYHAVNTRALTVLIPEYIVPAAGTCYLSLSAQRIDGDPLFETADYHSVASSGSTYVYANFD